MCSDGVVGRSPKMMIFKEFNDFQMYFFMKPNFSQSESGQQKQKSSLQTSVIVVPKSCVFGVYNVLYRQACLLQLGVFSMLLVNDFTQ